MSKKKILIIDDNEDIIEATKIILEKESYEVFSALTGDEGYKKAQEIKPDLIILDVMMETPGRGYEVARMIRKDSNISKTPLLMVTSIYDNIGFHLEGEPGDDNWIPVDAFLSKPVEKEILLSKIKDLLA